MQKNENTTKVGKVAKKEPKEKGVAVIQQTKELSFNERQQADVNTMISQAIAQGVPAETMERFLAMRRELKAEFAKEQFVEAMSKFQMECPIIVKNKTVPDKAGNVAYSFASIDSIISQVKYLIAKNGLSYMTKIEITAKGVKATCIVKHIAGHSENSEMEVPLGTKTGIMSDTQVTAAASSFAKRYAFLNAFGIMTGEEATGRALKGEIEEATEDEISKAKALIGKCQNMVELSKIWNGKDENDVPYLSKSQKANMVVVAYVKEIRGFIQNENSQNRPA